MRFPRLQHLHRRVMRTVRGTVPIILFVAGLLLLGGCAPRAVSPRLESISPRLESLYGPSWLESVRRPDRVEATRLRQERPPTGVPYRLLDTLKEISEPVRLDSDSAAELSAILSDDRSYGWTYTKGCLPTPGVKLRFAREKNDADVYLCFECGILISGNDIWAQFDPAASRLLAVIKRVFPTDSEIQSLGLYGRRSAR